MVKFNTEIESKLFYIKLIGYMHMHKSHLQYGDCKNSENYQLVDGSSRSRCNLVCSKGRLTITSYLRHQIY